MYLGTTMFLSYRCVVQLERHKQREWYHHPAQLSAPGGPGGLLPRVMAEAPRGGAQACVLVYGCATDDQRLRAPDERLAQG